METSFMQRGKNLVSETKISSEQAPILPKAVKGNTYNMNP